MRPLRTTIGRARAAAIAAAVVATAFMPSLVAHPNSRVLEGPSDVSSAAREYWSEETRGLTPFTSKRDPLLGAPEGTPTSTGVAVANAVQPLFVWSVKSVAGILGALNLFMLLGLVLTAAVMFALLDRLGLHPLAAALGAYAFTFNTYVIRKFAYGHAPLVHAWIFPALALALLGVRRRRTLGSAVVLGVLLASAFYVHSYYGAIATLLVCVLAGVELLTAPAKRTLRLLTAAVCTAVVLVLPGAIALALDRSSVSATFGHRGEATREFGARPLAYLLPAETNPVLGALVPDGVYSKLGPDGGEPELYFGWVAILLAGFGVVVLRRGRPDLTGERRFAATAAAVLVPVGFLASLPSNVSLFGVEVPTLTAIPSAFSSYLRVYGRFGILVGLGLALLAAIALDVLVRRRRGLLVGAGALALLAAELAYDLPIQTWNVSRTPAHVEFLARQPPGIVAVYPTQGDSAAENRSVREELFWQTRHAQPLFFTESSQKNRGWAIRELVDNLDEPGVPELLASQGVRYVVVADDVYQEIGERPPYVPETLRLLRRFDGARAYELIAKPSDPDAALHTKAARVASAMGIPVPTVSIPGAGFHDEERFGLAGQRRWLIQGGVIQVDVPNSEVEFELTATAFSAFRNRRLTLSDDDGVLGEVDVGTAALRFTIGPFRLPPGRSRLHLAASPGPEPLGGSDTRKASVFLSPVEIRPLADFSRR